MQQALAVAAKDRPVRTADPIDIHVGARVRERRRVLNISQARLAEAIGVTFQQVQKYERGFNRIGSSRIYEIARVLGQPVAFFFDGVDGRGGDESPRQAGDAADGGVDPMMKRETLKLVRAYYQVADLRVRKRLFEMIKAIAAAG